jgi:hypothetical protein
VTNWDPLGTSITVTIPALAVGSYTVAVNLNGVAVGQAPFLVTPQIQQLSLTCGPALMGMLVEGVGFGNVQGTVSFGVAPNQIQAPIIAGTWGSAVGNQQTIAIQVPAGFLNGNAASITVPVAVSVPYGPAPQATATSTAVNFTVVTPFACTTPGTYLRTQCPAN